MAVLGRPHQREDPARLRAHLRRHRAGDPGEGAGAADAVEADAQRELVRRSAEAMGVATIADLTDYFRIHYQADAKLRARELVEEGVLEAVSVPSWRGTGFPASRRRVASARGRRGAALAVRQHDLVARAHRARCLASATGSSSTRRPPSANTATTSIRSYKATAGGAGRPEGRSPGRPLLVQAAHLEPGADEGEVLGPLAAELRSAALWQGLADIRIAKRRPLERAFQSSVEPPRAWRGNRRRPLERGDVAAQGLRRQFADEGEGRREETGVQSEISLNMGTSLWCSAICCIAHRDWGLHSQGPAL